MCISTSAVRRRDLVFKSGFVCANAFVCKFVINLHLCVNLSLLMTENYSKRHNAKSAISVFVQLVLCIFNCELSTICLQHGGTYNIG